MTEEKHDRDAEHEPGLLEDQGGVYRRQNSDRWVGCISKDRPGGFGGGFGAVRGAHAQQRARYSLSLLHWDKSTNTDAAHPPLGAAHTQFTCLTGTKVQILTQQRATVFVPNSLDTQEPTGKVTIKGAMLASAYLFTVRRQKKTLAFTIRKNKKTEHACLHRYLL